MIEIFRIIMFISSLFPLWLSICIMSVFDNQTFLFFTSLTLIILSFMIFPAFSFFKKSEIPKQYTTVKIRKKENLKEYLLMNLLPIVIFDFYDASEFMVFITFFFLLGFLCVKNGYVYTNILLELKGYSMYLCEVEYQTGTNTYKKDLIAISKENLYALNNQNPVINYIKIDTDLYIEYSKEIL